MRTMLVIAAAALALATACSRAADMEAAGPRGPDADAGQRCPELAGVSSFDGLPGATVHGGERVDAGAFSLRAPWGDPWTTCVDRNRMVLFVRPTARPSVTTVAVLGWPLPAALVSRPDGEVADGIARLVEAGLKARGRTKAYEVAAVDRAEVTVADRRLLRARLSILDSSGPAPIRNSLAVNVAIVRRSESGPKWAFLFTLSELRLADDEGYVPTPFLLDPVIASFDVRADGGR